MNIDKVGSGQGGNGYGLFSIITILFISCVFISSVHGNAFSGKTDMQLNSNDRSAIIDTVISKLEELYVFSDIAQKMVDYIQEKRDNHAYDTITALEEFTHQLTNDLLSVYPDGHLDINVLKDRVTEMRPHESEEDWWARRVKEAQYNNFYFRKIEWLPGNIGYLDIRRFEFAEISGATAVAIMRFLAYTDAIIIDLRQNPGGRGELSQLLISYFFEDHRIHYATEEDNNRKITKQWWTIPYVQGVRKPDVPIYILTSRSTGSAAEEFAYTLKHLNRAVIVGDSTAGAAHKTHRHIFPELGIAINMPDGRTINPVTGKDWEGAGVIPHITVAPHKAFNIAYSHALDTLFNIETDENRLFRLEWVKKKLDADINPVILDKKIIKEYAGKYGPRKILLEKDKLFYQRENRPKYILVPLGDDWFRLDGLDYFRINFGRDPSGNVVELIGVYDDGSRDVNTRSGN